MVEVVQKKFSFDSSTTIDEYTTLSCVFVYVDNQITHLPSETRIIGIVGDPTQIIWGLPNLHDELGLNVDFPVLVCEVWNKCVLSVVKVVRDTVMIPQNSGPEEELIVSKFRNRLKYWCREGDGSLKSWNVAIWSLGSIHRKIRSGKNNFIVKTYNSSNKWLENWSFSTQ